MERLRQFGELVNIAGKDNFKGHEEVLELLQIMVEDLGANVTEQQWYQEVRCRVGQVDCTSCS